MLFFGQTSRSRWDILLHGSIINRFLGEVREATVQVVPLEQNSGDRSQRQNELVRMQQTVVRSQNCLVPASEF
jgi:K+-sensing histidine kinase KdpD